MTASRRRLDKDGTGEMMAMALQYRDAEDLMLIDARSELFHFFRERHAAL